MQHKAPGMGNGGCGVVVVVVGGGGLFPQCLDWTSLEGVAEGRAESLGQRAKVTRE